MLTVTTNNIIMYSKLLILQKAFITCFADKMTAAHKTMAFGTKVEIINIENSKKIIVTVNDRGPLKAGRAFDLSQGAFKKLGNLNEGILKVRYKVVR